MISTVEQVISHSLTHTIESGFEIAFSDAIPLNELFNAIDEHYQIRVEIAKLKKTLEDRSYQFRIIQKRLLNRFKVN
jgi:hypothetical protein